MCPLICVPRLEFTAGHQQRRPSWLLQRFCALSLNTCASPPSAVLPLSSLLTAFLLSLPACLCPYVSLFMHSDHCLHVHSSGSRSSARLQIIFLLFIHFAAALLLFFFHCLSLSLSRSLFSVPSFSRSSFCLSFAQLSLPSIASTGTHGSTAGEATPDSLLRNSLTPLQAQLQQGWTAETAATAVAAAHHLVSRMRDEVERKGGRTESKKKRDLLAAAAAAALVLSSSALQRNSRTRRRSAAASARVSM